MTFLTVNKTSLIPHSAFHTEAATSKIFTSFFPATERKHGHYSTVSYKTKCEYNVFSPHNTWHFSLSYWEHYITNGLKNVFILSMMTSNKIFFFPLQHYRCMVRRDTQFHSRAFKRVQISASTIRLVAQHLKITCKQSIALGQVPKHGSYQGKTNWQFRDSWINSR